MTDLMARHRQRARNAQLTADLARLRSNYETFTVLTIRDLRRPLTDDEMTAFTDALKVNTHLEKIKLEWWLQGVSPDSLRSFLEALLATHPSLKEVHLEADLTAEHFAWIAETMKSNTSLKKLRLRVRPWNKVGVEGCRAMAEMLSVNKTLEKLDLENNNIGDNGCILIATALDKYNLKILKLGYNGIGNAGVIVLSEGLVKNKSLRRLILRNNDIDDVGCRSIAKALCRNPFLCVLDLQCNRITDAGVAALEPSLHTCNYSLESVELWNITGWNFTGVTHEQLNRILHLCENNRFVKRSADQMKNASQFLSQAAWPKALELFKDKPDLILAAIRLKPEFFPESDTTALVGRLQRQREIAERTAESQIEHQIWPAKEGPNTNNNREEIAVDAEVQNEQEWRLLAIEADAEVQKEQKRRRAAEAEVQRERQTRLAAEAKVADLERMLQLAVFAENRRGLPVDDENDDDNDEDDEDDE